ncbi:MAG: TonB-dependent receptor [Halioglobus sp.]|nr:TonB-dependent receptor [Halioglobus sp.]
MKAALLLLIVFLSYSPAFVKADNPALNRSHDRLIEEEVVITARKRVERLQETPIAVSAFSAEALRVAGITNIRDLQESVPGLSISEMGNKAPSIFIRGVGQKESSAALDPGVGVYINSIYIARTDSQLLDLMDTESIQVLRGPQGTLFGKNNTGGALLVTTKKPYIDALETAVSVRIGDYGRRDFKVSTNIPLNDSTLATRVSIKSTHMDGYLKNTFNGAEYGDQDRLGATARVYWEPSDTFSADLFYYWSQVDERGAGLTCFFQNPDSVFNTFTWPGFTTPKSYESRCRISEAESSNGKVLINGPSKFEMSSQIIGLTVNWKYDDFEIKSISSWSYQNDIGIVNDSDATDIAGVETGPLAVRGGLEASLASGYGNFSIPDNETRNQYSQELQLTGTAFDNRLSYTSGFFVAIEELKNTMSGNMVGDKGYSYKANVSTIIPKIIGTNSDLSSDSYAFFAQGTYQFTDWYQITAGTRYTIEKRQRKALLYKEDCNAILTNRLVQDAIDLCAFDVLGLGDPSNFYVNPPTVLPVRLAGENGSAEADKKWSRWTPTITGAFSLPNRYLEGSIFDSTLLYLTYSKGFKSGGFEMKGLEISQFEPESVSSYEIGIKLDAFSQRLRFNTAFFYMDYDDIQIRITEQGQSFADILLFIDNAGAATIQGFEMELTARPFPNIVLNATTGYTDARYDQFIASDVDTSAIPPVQSTIDRSDEDFAAIPKLTYSFSAMGILPTGIGVFTPRLSMYYRDSLYTGLDATAWDSRFRNLATIDDVTLWNFRLGYTPVDNDDIQLWFFIDNLANENYFQGGFSNTESLGAGSYVLGPPRTYGFEASIAF